MRIELEHYNQTITMRTEGDDVGLDEVMQMVRSLLIAARFHPDSVAEYVEAN